MATARGDARVGRNLSGGQFALIILALVVLLGVLWFVFLRGDAPSETPAVAPPAAPAPTPEPEQTAKPGRGPVETFEVFAPKDPFRPAIVAAVAGGEAVPAPGATAGPAGGNGGGGDGSVGGGEGGDAGGGSDSVGGHRVRLVDVFSQNGEQRARVQVDGTVYTVEEGDRFADNFELLSIEGRCASLLFGDDQFTLCEGEEILK